MAIALDVTVDGLGNLRVGVLGFDSGLNREAGVGYLIAGRASFA